MVVKCIFLGKTIYFPFLKPVDNKSNPEHSSKNTCGFIKIKLPDGTVLKLEILLEDFDKIENETIDRCEIVNWLFGGRVDLYPTCIALWIKLGPNLKLKTTIEGSDAQNIDDILTICSAPEGDLIKAMVQMGIHIDDLGIDFGI